MSNRVHYTILTVMTLALVALIGYVLWQGGSYYTTPVDWRPDMEELDSLYKPSGLIGHGLGFMAGFCMTGLFLYILRKRIPFMRRWGKLRNWLRYHIWMGIAGPLLATLHSSFKFGGVIGVAYYAMLAVMLSGFIGRYLYGKIPRRLSGEELSLKQAQTRRLELLRRLEFEFGLRTEDLKSLEAALERPQHSSLASALMVMMKDDLLRRFRINRMVKELQKRYNLPPAERKYLSKTLLQEQRLAQHLLLLDAIHKVFHWWHVIHRPFAYSIFVIIILHTVLTLSFGYRWIF